jgi:hypothetical protein
VLILIGGISFIALVFHTANRMFAQCNPPRVGSEVVAAAHQYQRDHGRLPESLDNLRPGYLPHDAPAEFEIVHIGFLPEYDGRGWLVRVDTVRFNEPQSWFQTSTLDLPDWINDRTVAVAHGYTAVPTTDDLPAGPE